MQFKDDRVNAAMRKAEAMTGLVTQTHAELPSPEVIGQVLLGGDLAKLTPAQRVSYYRAVCDSVGLNPLTKPFDFITLPNGKMVFYANRNCTDQLRKLYDISVVITAREVINEVYVVTARASLPNGRADESTGAVPVAALKGEALANAYMRCETKSKRRVTLSLVGLSTLDESEVESIPGAVKIDPPVLASVDARDPAAAVGAAAVPADLNQQIPDTWKPFVASDGDEILRGVVRQVDAETKTNKKGRKFTKTSITLDTGEVVTTLTGTLAATARDCFQRQTPVEIRVQPSRWGKEIVTIAQVGDDVAF